MHQGLYKQRNSGNAIEYYRDSCDFLSEEKGEYDEEDEWSGWSCLLCGFGRVRVE
jgi:hypothetical protein